MSQSSLTDRLATSPTSFRQRYQRLIDDGSAVESMDNETKRVLYSELELLKMCIEDDTEGTGEGPGVIEDITDFEKRLSLDYAKREKRWWTYLDEPLRFLGVWLLFMTFACFFSLPVIMVGMLDRRLTRMGVLRRQNQLAPLMQRTMATFVLMVSGVHLTEQGLTAEKFAIDGGHTDKRVVCFFTHASTLDAFIICASCPVPYTVLAKKELFLLPFFGWLLIAFGGVPINRNNRAEAVRSMNQAAKGTREGDCVLVSPEGTRSPSGQLISFKKGPLYLWESMEAKIVPIVIFGAYDLCPPGKIMTHTGRIYIRYLDPICRSEALTRDQMSRLARRRMLTALMDAPKDSAGDVSVFDRLVSFCVLGGVLLLDSFILEFLAHFFFVRIGLTVRGLSILMAMGSVIITLCLYVYAVYLGPTVADVGGCCTTSFESTSGVEMQLVGGGSTDESREPMLRGDAENSQA